MGEPFGTHDEIRFAVAAPSGDQWIEAD